MEDSRPNYRGFQIHFYRFIADAVFPAESSGDIFLTKKYYEALEKAPPQGFSFCYALITSPDSHAICGFIAAAVKSYNAAESLFFKNTTVKKQPFSQRLKYRIANSVQFSALVIGNPLLTGEHGFWFDKNLTDLPLVQRLLFHGIEALKISLRKQCNIKINATLAKDFYLNSPACRQASFLKSKNYIPFQAEPGFIFTVKPEWKNMDDYLKALSSKYRIRARRAFTKLGADVVRKEFSEADLIEHKKEMHQLYLFVKTSASFNLTDLPDDYFLQLKRSLKNNFHVFGYFLNNRLIGFFSVIDNQHAELESHFIGYDTSANQTRQIYLNMLFDIIKQGIEGSCSRIIFGRTAHEIKSSVGARPVELLLFIKHNNRIVHFLLPLLFRYLYLRERKKRKLRNPYRIMVNG